MAAPLRAVVLGAGFAGQGHARALRECGVDVVAIAGRTETVVREVAGSLGINQATTNWQHLLLDLRPDIVAVATPAGTHVDMASSALSLGCHVYLDKPLATTAADARGLYQLSRKVGVKTAYAASYRYQPAVLLARELVQAGEIGPLFEVECISHYHWPKLTSYGWPHRLETGGGRLNNNFTHKLAIVLAVMGGTVLAATGETRNDLRVAPVGPPSHDFRNFTRHALTPEEASRCEWRAVNSDWAYTALARIGEPGTDPRDAATALFRHSALRLGRIPDHIAFYGETGTIHLDGAYAQGALSLGRSKSDWQEVSVPTRIIDALPAIADDTQRNWTQLAREFVADIRGEGDSGYLKFRDGWLFQEVVERVRRESNWSLIPTGL